MKKKRNALIFIIILSAIIIIGFAVFFTLKYININSAKNDYNKLSSSVVQNIDNTENASQTIDEKSAENPIDFASLTKKNDEIYSWIYIPDTNINYPVCQSKTDDNFYLDHDISKNYSYAGAIYSQVCNSTDYSDRVTVLYGHNMADGSMFADLHNYTDINYLKKHENIYIYTDTRKLTYKVVSAFIYDDRHIMNSFNFSDDKVFEEYLDMIKNPHSLSSCVNDSIELDTNDKIITLSTCLNIGDGRFLLQGVLVNDEQTK